VSGETPEFFTQMQGCRAAYRRLADCIREHMRPGDSVLDIGCGVGHVIERLAEGGHFVTGWDGLLAREAAGDGIRKRIRVVDLAVPPYPPPANVVICTETGEHLPDAAADGLVEACVSANPRTIVWSAAPPGQEWEGHINLQPAEYWLAKFGRLRYAPNMAATGALRARMLETEAQHVHCRANFSVLERDGA
jgi:SAM-dependent methyltransferase